MKYFFTLLVLFVAHTAYAVDTVPSKKSVLPPPQASQENVQDTNQHYNGTLDQPPQAAEEEPSTEAEPPSTNSSETASESSLLSEEPSQAGYGTLIVAAFILLGAGIGAWLLKRKTN